MKVERYACVSAGGAAKHLRQTVPVGVTCFGEDLAIGIDLKSAGGVVRKLLSEDRGDRVLRLILLPEEWGGGKKENWQQQE
jgi:hypothetical protein